MEPCPRYCRSIWHSKTRIAHIRKKFALQRNFHKQQDDFLDERQVLLHRVKFKPQSIINSKNNLIEDVSRAQLQSLLATISTDRSQLERIVRKELEVEKRNQEKKNLLVARLATVQLLLTSGVSEDEMEATIIQPPKQFDRHRNLLRAMFLEFADVLATLLDENLTSIRPPSRDLSADDLKLFGDDSDEEKIMESQSDNEETDTDAGTDTDYETDEEFNSSTKFDSDDDDSSKPEGTKEHKKSRQSTAAGDDIREFCMELQNVGFDFGCTMMKKLLGGWRSKGFDECVSVCGLKKIFIIEIAPFMNFQKNEGKKKEVDNPTHKQQDTPTLTSFLPTPKARSQKSCTIPKNLRFLISHTNFVYFFLVSTVFNKREKICQEVRIQKRRRRM